MWTRIPIVMMIGPSMPIRGMNRRTIHGQIWLPQKTSKMTNLKMNLRTMMMIKFQFARFLVARLRQGLNMRFELEHVTTVWVELLVFELRETP